MNKNIAIIGAGIAGLTAAYYLQKFGYSVTVYEASNRVGGRMTTDTINDCLIDRGAQFLSVYYSTIMPLIQELDMSSQLVEINPWVGVVRDRKIRKISQNHFFSPLISRYLSIKEAFQFLSTLRRWQTTILTLPLDDYAKWHAFDDESATQFIMREFGESILEYMIEPQLQGYYFQSPEAVSRIQALLLFNFALRRGKLFSLIHGIDSLPRKLATCLNVKLNCPITSIDFGSNREITLKSNASSFYADRVVLATTATAGQSLFKEANELETSLLKTKYSSTINISIATHKNWKLPWEINRLYGFLIPRRERQKIAAIAIESNKNKASSRENELFNIMLDGYHGEQFLSMSDNEILQEILPEFENYFPGISQFIHLLHITRWKEAEPISFIGKSKKIKEYKDTLNSTSNIILAGDYMGFPHTDSAAYTGKWAANFIKDSDNR